MRLVFYSNTTKNYFDDRHFYIVSCNATSGRTHTVVITTQFIHQDMQMVNLYFECTKVCDILKFNFGKNVPTSKLTLITNADISQNGYCQVYEIPGSFDWTFQKYINVLPAAKYI